MCQEKNRHKMPTFLNTRYSVRNDFCPGAWVGFKLNGNVVEFFQHIVLVKLSQSSSFLRVTLSICEPNRAANNSQRQIACSFSGATFDHL